MAIHLWFPPRLMIEDGAKPAGVHYLPLKPDWWTANGIRAAIGPRILMNHGGLRSVGAVNSSRYLMGTRRPSFGVMTVGVFERIYRELTCSCDRAEVIKVMTQQLSPEKRCTRMAASIPPEKTRTTPAPTTPKPRGASGLSRFLGVGGWAGAARLAQFLASANWCNRTRRTAHRATE
jgi:hypothetical protein